MHCNQFQKQFAISTNRVVTGHNTSKEGAVERPQVATARGKRTDISEDSFQRKLNFQ